MEIIAVHNSIMNSVTYVLYSNTIDYCILIDCGEFRTLHPVLRKLGKPVKAVFLTHGHSDHIYGLKELIKKFPNVDIYSNAAGHEELGNPKKNLSFYHERQFTIDGYNAKAITDSTTIEFPGLGVIHPIETPGHDVSCISYIIDENVFTGDAYIPGVKVFTKFPRGDKAQAEKSTQIIKQYECQGFKVFPGHYSV